MNRLIRLRFKSAAILLALAAMWLFGENVCAQKITVKTNALGWATTTFNAGVEGRFNDHLTGELSVYYNPFTFSDNKKISGLAIQPELRYWFCIPYYKHFMGLHAMYSDYNVGWTNYRYQGNLFGGGLSYGYQMILSQNWNLEFSLGIGYARMNHDKFYREKCGFFIGHQHDNYIGVTKIGISLVYIIK